MTAVDPKQYARVMEGAREDVFVVAARRSLNLDAITVQFDAGRGPGTYPDHVLTISIRGDAVAVERAGIPHEWIATIGTGYIDTRFVKCVASLLAELEKKATDAGIQL
ncbi:MAG TPA: hypothetical protein VJT81_13140 [Burkholderiales bacterium]|nr:hypothetical protein [Burkholderiales bacterium]